MEAAASRDAMEIQYRMFEETLCGGGTLNPRIECPGETLKTRWGHFFLGKSVRGGHICLGKSVRGDTLSWDFVSGWTHYAYKERRH